MGFKSDIEAREPQTAGGSKFRKTRWFFPRPGSYNIRILHEDYATKYTHWLKSGGRGITIECIGEDNGCPICMDNQTIIAENPDVNPRTIAGFNAFTKTAYVNILDKTLVKVAPESGEENYADENGTFPLVSYGKTHESIVDVQPAPSNKVKVFSRSAGVFDTIKDYDKSIRESAGKSITDYDLTIIVRPKQGNQIGSNLSFIPQTHLDDVVELEEELYDLDTVLIQLNPNEVRELQRGVSLSDIFSARKSSESEKTAVDGFEDNASLDNTSKEVETKSEEVANELSNDAQEFLKALDIE